MVAGGAASTAQKVTEVGFAAPEKPTDYGWNQQGLVGAKKAAKATGAKVIDATGSGYDNVEPNLRRLAQQGADLIIAHASGYNSAAPAVAQEFNVPVVVWDAKASAVKKGLVSNVLTRAQQGAYLAGVLAALTSKTGTLGIVVSASDENWFKQSGGYCQGARSVNKAVKFKYGRIGQADYADAAGGRRITRAVIAGGADVVFGMGDGSSFGMMQAVETAKAPAGREEGLVHRRHRRQAEDRQEGRAALVRAVGLRADLHARHQGRERRHVRDDVLPGREERPLAAEDEQGAGLRLGEGRCRAEEDRQRLDQGRLDGHRARGQEVLQGLTPVGGAASIGPPRSHRPAMSTGSPTTSATDGRAQPAVELVGITKAFPGVLANDAISLTVRRGEVHCLLGENGAGKSTLMNILAGMIRPDAGEIRLEGRQVDIHSPKHAIELGIGMVYQHTSLVPQLTVLENLMLGEGEGIRLNASAARARLADLGGSIGLDVDPSATTGTLALGQQQQLEIIKALWRGSKVLILDEPTSMLTPAGVAELEQILERLKAQGLSVIFITHKLHEAVSIGDRVSVLSQGRLVGAIEPDELRSASHEELQERIVGLMFGSQLQQAAGVVELTDDVEWHTPARRLDDDEPALELEDVTVAPAARGDRGPRRVAERAEERDHGRRGRRRERPARARRGDRGTTTRRRRRHPAVRPLDRSLQGGTAGEARPALRHRRPPARGDGRLALGGDERGAQADRQAAVLGARPDPLRGDRREGAGGDLALRHPHAEPGDARRGALRRQRPEGRARARAVVRPQGGRLQQADLRTRREDDEERAPDDSRPGARPVSPRSSSPPTSTSCSISATASRWCRAAASPASSTTARPRSSRSAR